MYTYTHKGRTHKHEDLQTVRKNAYAQLTMYNERIHIEKDNEPYGMMVLLDDGVWIFTLEDKEYRKVRPSGTIAK